MNTSIIPVFTAVVADEPTQLCNARELHSVLQVGRDFATWIKDRLETYGFTDGEDFVVAQTLSSPNPGIAKSRAQKRIDYHLTLDTAKELAMIENNEIGRQVRRYFIRLEKQAIAAGLRIDAVVNRAETGELSALMAQRFPAGKDRPYAWSPFNNHFRLASYRDLPKAKFAEACAYIQQMPVKQALGAPDQPGIEGEYMPASESSLNVLIEKLTAQVEAGNGTSAEIFQPLVLAVLKKRPEMAGQALTDEQLSQAAMKQLRRTRFVLEFGSDSDYFGTQTTPIMIPFAKGAKVFKPGDVVDELATDRQGFFTESDVKNLLTAISQRINPAKNKLNS